ncbi:MAG: MarR family transcriptional regulator [Streptococcaceae bacterium]|jgi:DNA-binding MarR family transcriptional regulator|nr:MarR family transcriptional regulator [Streptococcaceae bacterium]
MTRQTDYLALFGEIFEQKSFLDRPLYEAALTGFSDSEIDVVNALAKTERDMNVTRLAAKLYLTRSAITKITRKLLQKGILTSYQLPDNKKEIYFRLSQAGNHLSQVHDSVEASLLKRDDTVFETMSEKEFKTLMTFGKSYKQHLDKEINEN